LAVQEVRPGVLFVEVAILMIEVTLECELLLVQLLKVRPTI
jgi:hypothetical protein